jgi:restriction system protein
MAIWLVKAGREGVFAERFKVTSKIAIGWERLGDFDPSGSWEEFRAHVKEKLPEDFSANQVGSAAGQLWAFIREMAVNDFVISPVKSSREVLIGKVTGQYVFDPTFDYSYQRTRTVEWYTPLPWDSLPDEMRRCFSQWLTISKPRVDFTPVIERARNSDTSPIPSEESSVADVLSEEKAEDLSDRAEEAIRQMLRGMTHVDFQRFVGGVFEATGFTVLYNSAGRGRDGGVDILLSKDSLGASQRIVVQVKQTDGSVGQPELQQLLGTLRPDEFGLMVSLSGINSGSERYWRDNRDRLLKPLESADLVRLLQDHYEKLGDQYKTLVPLKRIYVPVPAEVTE